MRCARCWWLVAGVGRWWWLVLALVMVVWGSGEWAVCALCCLEES